MTAETRRAPLWKRLYQGWLEVAMRFGEVQTTLIVALVYALVIGPMATAAGLARRDLLDQRTRATRQGTAWRDADTVTSPDLERSRRLF